MLLGNYNIFNNNPGRAIGGITNPCAYLKAGTMMLFYHANEAAIPSTTNKSSFNNGYVPPYSWVLAPKPGGLALPGTMRGASAFTGNIAAGRNLSVTMAGVSALALVGQLITSGTLSASGSTQMTADIKGILSGTLTAAGSGSFSATLNALSGAMLAMSGSGAFSANILAKANMTLAFTSLTELSPESLAATILNSVIDGDYTLQDVLKVLAAIAAGKTTITDLGGGNATVVFRDIADSRDAVTADMTDSERTNITIT